MAEGKKVADAKKAEDDLRRIVEAKKAEYAKKASDARLAAAEAKAADAKMAMEVAKAAEAKKLAEVRAAEEAKKAAEAKKQEPAATVRVYFASDRNRTGSTEAVNFYGYERASLSYGYSDVSIPKTHTTGIIERPRKILFWDVSENPKWHIVVVNIAGVTAPDFFARLRRENDGQKGTRQAFVFVHGFATGFRDALMRAAQMKYDLHFPGAAILYSWPSTGSESTYGADEDSMSWSTNNLRSFLLDVSEKSGADEIFLIGHSMGTRGLAAAISTIAETATRKISSRYKQVILAAPDIDRKIFQDRIFPAIKKAGMTLTVYASDRDRALYLSQLVHSYPRLGSTTPSPFILDGIVTIDASAVDTSFWGHAYYAENRSIISDVYYLIRNTPLAKRFGLQSVDGPHGQYWKFKQ